MEAQRGPEGLWATPLEPVGAPPMALEGEEGLSGEGCSGMAGVDFHFPFGSDQGIPLPEAGLLFLLPSWS